MNTEISFAEYKNAVESIKQYIQEGETYQINLTFNNRIITRENPASLYARLRTSQPTGLCSMIDYGEGTIISLSPELFYRKDKGALYAKPMKGTAARSCDNSHDLKQKRLLAQDTKNRSENLMIVDLLRNDIGKISISGSVNVPRLFSIETHPTLHQMTSTIQGKTKPGSSFVDRIKALFPCGSVTGAPKIRAMEIINELEKGQRGVYCGAIGFLSPHNKERFSVPIRTLHKGVFEDSWSFRLGSGIVWDSSPEQEWRECILKGDFIKKEIPDFSIIESLLLYKNRFRYPREHADRMKRSAGYFLIPFSKESFNNLLKEIRDKSSCQERYKVRVVLEKSGELSYSISRISGSPAESRVIAFSNKKMDSKNIYLYHKTTLREWYSDSVKKIRTKRVYDQIYLNENGEVTEGSRTNIFINNGGTLYTPPVYSGLLPGILREVLLRKGQCIEKILYLEDIENAEEIFCGNSVRGLVRVNLKVTSNNSVLKRNRAKNTERGA